MTMRDVHDRTGSPEPLFEALEGRQLLAADLPFTLYYPEGFAHGGISEFVPIANPNDFVVHYELHARYAGGERDQLIASGAVQPNSRSGVRIATAGRPDEMLVSPNRPYALVLKSNGPVSATLSHYDFATAIGESFTDQTSIEWTFGDVRRNSEETRAFLVYYNPNDVTVVVQTTLYGEDGSIYTFGRTIDAQRRGGWNVDADMTAVPEGRYGVRVTSSAPIVAAISQYGRQTGRGYGALGQPDGGALAGTISAMDFSNERGFGDFPPGPGEDFPADGTLSILNLGPTEATIVLRFLEHDSPNTTIVPPKTVRVGARSSVSLSMTELGLPTDRLFGVVYRSDVPVAVHGSVDEGLDGTGVVGATSAATIWDFAEGFMNQSRAGGDVTEDLYLFNPTNTAAEVTIRFMTGLGVNVTITRTVGPLEIADIRFHETPEIRDLQNQVFYAVRVTSTQPIVATMEHWDRDLGGGFSYLGMPRGDIFDLSDVLVT